MTFSILQDFTASVVSYWLTKK